MSAPEPVIPAGYEAFYNDFHFAPATRVGDRLYVSGQIGFADGLGVSDDPETQFTAAFEHVKAVLAGAGKTLADIVDMTTFHVGLQQHAATFMAVKDRYIEAPYPSWTAIGISELFVPGALVEIKVIATG
ncbi:MAG: RidA family protein [Rhodospirillales bacterium]|nr:RidA family protein [Rhodospirillales bacterium]